MHVHIAYTPSYWNIISFSSLVVTDLSDRISSYGSSWHVEEGARNIWEENVWVVQQNYMWPQ